MFEADEMALLARETLRERAGELIRETCGWSVGLSDTAHYLRRHGRIVPSGVSLGVRAAVEQPLGSDEDGRLELADAPPGSFRDALGALAGDGSVHADRLEEQVLVPFVHDTCLRAAERARREHPAEWADLAEDVGEDDGDLVEVVRAAEWEAPLRTEAEHLVLAALGDVPLVEVEAEGLPLSLVRAAEALTRAAAPVVAAEPPAPEGPVGDDDLAGARYLAELALETPDLTVPVPPDQSGVLVQVLLAQGLEPDEVRRLLPALPVQEETAQRVAERLDALPPG